MTNSAKEYYHLSSLYAQTRDADLLISAAKMLKDDHDLSKENKNFIYRKLLREHFLRTELQTKEFYELLFDIYDDIYESYLACWGNDLLRIPAGELNSNLVFIFTSQFLTGKHAPSRIVLDRAYFFQKLLGKKVLIINTADIGASSDQMQWADDLTAMYEERLNEIEQLEYKDEEFNFFQCPNTMPVVEMMKSLTDLIKRMRPYMILSVGASNLTADISDKLVPCVCLSTVTEAIQPTRSSFLLLPIVKGGRQACYVQITRARGIEIVEGRFTFDLRAAQKVYTRKEFAFPEKKKVCAVVGTRLDTEIDEAFLTLLKNLMSKDIAIAIVGVYDNYEAVANDDPLVKSHMINLGLVSDVPGVLSCVDLYLNPKRAGGGTNAADALNCGVPVVTLGYGDVAAISGEEFCVDSYDEMEERTLRLLTDADYYNELSRRAKSVAKLLCDGAGEFIRVITEVEKRKAETAFMKNASQLL